jgi:hypothetical protein
MDAPFEPENDLDLEAGEAGEPAGFAEAPVDVRVTSFAPPAPAGAAGVAAALTGGLAAMIPQAAPAAPMADLWNDTVTVADETPAEPEGGRIAENDEVANLLAPFFHKGFLARREAKGLMDPNKRAEAEKRLNGVGLTLAWSPYSRYYGLALADGPGGKTERITNLNELDRNALALLVIMWARLVLPQRLAEEGREGGVAEPTVAFDALNAEYGKKLGGRRFEMYVSQLKRLGFLEYTRKDEIKAGPFLDLLGDSNKLASFLRQSTLAKVLADQPTAEAEAEEADEAADAVEA